MRMGLRNTVGIAGRAGKFNGDAPFDVVVIDEAAQALKQSVGFRFSNPQEGDVCLQVTTANCSQP